ncbi:hypothetical protein Tco_0492758 [Tanacetum coccineum]
MRSYADRLVTSISTRVWYHILQFKIEPELGNLTMDGVEKYFPNQEKLKTVSMCLDVLPTHLPPWIQDITHLSETSLRLNCMDLSSISYDCPDCEDSQFCHSSRVSHPQLQLGIRYPNLID